MDLSNRKITNHPPSLDFRTNYALWKEAQPVRKIPSAELYLGPTAPLGSLFQEAVEELPNELNLQFIHYLERICTITY